MSTPKPSQSPGPQLRNSCDACNLAKVKCTKSKPRCKRCDSKNEVCTYSISLRSVSRKHQYGCGSLSPNSGIDITRKCIVDGKVVDSSPIYLPGSNMITPPLSDIGELEVFDHAHFEPTWTHPSFQETYIDDPKSPLAQYVNSDRSMADVSMAGSDLSLISPLDLTEMAAHHPPANLPQAANSCACHEAVLTQLADLSMPFSIPLPFDAALGLNKSILATAANVLRCRSMDPYHNRSADTPLFFSLCALLTHAIRAFDCLVQTRRERKAHPQAQMHPQQSTIPQHAYPQHHHQHQDHPTATSYSHPLHSTIPHHPFTSPWDSHAPPLQAGSITIPSGPGISGGRRKSVRLMLGSYQLDREDEEMLQGSLIRIELGKIERVLDALEMWTGFEGREDDDGGRALVGGLVGYLRGRLRANEGAV